MHIVFGVDLDDGGFPGPLPIAADRGGSGSGSGSGSEAACLDAAWVGVSGLVALLEVRLGLLRLDPPKESERAADLARRLRGLSNPKNGEDVGDDDGDDVGDEENEAWPWQRSLEVDPLATARSVLRLRDALRMAGVGDAVDAALVEALPPRLKAVQRATVDVLPGLADRLLEVIEAVEAGDSPRVDRLEVFWAAGPSGHPDQTGDTENTVSPARRPLPGLVRRLLLALAGVGVEVVDVDPVSMLPPLTTPPTTDLAHAQHPELLAENPFVGDGSLLLWRPDTPEECADDVAALIANDPHVVIVGADVVLDEALHRRGGPTLGVRGDAAEDALLSILPLIVALDDDNPDPDRLFELLSLPVSPIPRTVGAPIQRALMDAPSAVAPTVLEALLTGLTRLKERHAVDVGDEAATTRHRNLATRLAAIVPAWGPTLAEAIGGLPPSPKSLEATTTSATTTATTTAPSSNTGTERHHDVARVVARLKPVLTVFAGRGEREYGNAERSPYRAAMRQMGLCIRTLEALGEPTLSDPQMSRILDAATRSVASMAPWPAEAGLQRVGRPGSVCGPVKTVVWWSFSRERGRLPQQVFSTFEREALADLGFVPGDLTAIANAFANAQRRPLLFATERLIVCAPRRGPGGRELHLHPIWDEILAGVPKAERRAAERALTRPDPDIDDRRGLVPRERAPLRARDPLRLAQGIVVHRFPAGALQPREVTSPSREETLLGCELRFAVEERLGRGRDRHVKRGPALEGDVVHAVLATVLREAQRRQGPSTDSVDTVDTVDTVNTVDTFGFSPPVPLNPLSPDEAADLARLDFDVHLRRRAAAWARPGREQVAMRVRERAARAAAALITMIRHNDFVIAAVEEPFHKVLPVKIGDEVTEERTLQGSPDLVLDGVDVDGNAYRFVLDHKTGQDESRAALLRLGVPLQLLDYALLVGEKGRPWPGFGYFQLTSRRVLTSDKRLLGVEHVDPVERTPAQGFWALEQARREAFAHLHRGLALAPGASPGSVPQQVSVDGDVARLPPPCRYCNADVLCGRFLKTTQSRLPPPRTYLPTTAPGPVSTPETSAERSALDGADDASRTPSSAGDQDG